MGVSALAMVVIAALAGLAGRALFGGNAMFPLTMVFVLSGLYVLVCGFLWPPCTTQRIGTACFMMSCCPRP